jgi:DNA-binding transcriptional LysR family regulator
MRGITTTEAGKRIVPYALAIEEEHRKLKERLREKKSR